MNGKNADIENRFVPHAVNGTQADHLDAVREKAKELAYLIEEVAPKTREQALALTNLEQVVFWANAAIARNPQGS